MDILQRIFTLCWFRNIKSWSCLGSGCSTWYGVPQPAQGVARLVVVVLVAVPCAVSAAGHGHQAAAGRHHALRLGRGGRRQVQGARLALPHIDMVIY